MDEKLEKRLERIEYYHQKYLKSLCHDNPELLKIAGIDSPMALEIKKRLEKE